MNELIKVKQSENGEPLVSAREIWGKLECGQDFTNWFKYQAEKMELVQLEDFTPILAESTGGRPSVDYLIKVDTAKHICMMSGGKNAKELRQYFIEIEKAWNSPEKVMARALQMAQASIDNFKNEIRQLTPKAEYFDALVERNLLTNFRDTAKELGVKQQAFINRLLEQGFLYRDQQGTLKPYAKYTPSLFELKECKGEASNWAGVQTLITPRGRETFRLLMYGDIARLG